jgi:hypothetical protein
MLLLEVFGRSDTEALLARFFSKVCIETESKMKLLLENTVPSGPTSQERKGQQPSITPHSSVHVGEILKRNHPANQCDGVSATLVVAPWALDIRSGSVQLHCTKSDFLRVHEAHPGKKGAPTLIEHE